MVAAVRVLNVEDAAALFALRREALTDSPLSFYASIADDRASSVTAVEEMLSRGPAAPVFGAFSESLVGMVGLYRDGHEKGAHKVFLWGMYVRPQARGLGFGRRLLGTAVDHARGLDGARLLHLSVSETAPGAKGLYERAGFTVWGTEPEGICYNGARPREFHMVLPLT